MRATFHFGSIKIALMVILLLAFGCSKKTTTTSTADAGKYSEDLSVWRDKLIKDDTAKSVVTQVSTEVKKDPTRYVEPKFAVNENLDIILDSISKINLENGYVDGYTIQVYSGVKREEALNVKKDLTTSLPQLDSEVQYVQPNFRVRTGKYYDRLSAQKDYLAVKRYFPHAIVIPDRIAIN